MPPKHSYLSVNLMFKVENIREEWLVQISLSNYTKKSTKYNLIQRHVSHRATHLVMGFRLELESKLFPLHVLGPVKWCGPMGNMNLSWGTFRGQKRASHTPKCWDMGAEKQTSFLLKGSCHISTPHFPFLDVSYLSLWTCHCYSCEKAYWSAIHSATSVGYLFKW